MPAEMGLTGWLPTSASSSIEDDFHNDLLSLLAKILLDTGLLIDFYF